MIMQWLDFKIDTQALLDYVDSITDKHDGIVCQETYFEIIEKTDFTTEEQDLINSYIESLTETGESQKLNAFDLLKSKILEIKETLVYKDLSELTTIEKKILMGLDLTEQEIEQILSN